MSLVSYVWDDKLGVAKSIQALLNSSLKKNEWWSALSQSDWESHYAFGNDSDIEGINEFLEEFLVRVIVRSLYYNNLNSAGSIVGEVGGDIVKIKPMYAKLNNVINPYFAIKSN